MPISQYIYRIICYDEHTELDPFSSNVYWGDGYQEVYYIASGEFRSEGISDTEESTNALGGITRYKSNYRERYKLAGVVAIGQVAVLASLDRFDNKRIEVLNSRGDVVSTHIVNALDVEDTGNAGDANAQVLITWEDYPRTNAHPSNTRLTQNNTVGWDVDGDQLSDSDNGPAEAAESVNSFAEFTFAQLYQLISPTITSIIKAWVIKPSGQRFDFGTFQGKLGDSLNDPTKWSGNSNVWKFFSASSVVGNNAILTFNKYDFAISNGFVSTERSDNSVIVQFDLRTPRSNVASVQIPRLYTAWGAFSSTRVLDNSSGISGIWTIGNSIAENTLREYKSFRRPTSPTNSPVDATYDSYVLVQNTAIAQRYNTGSTTTGERIYEGALRTNGGYLAEWRRASYNNDSFSFSVSEGFEAGGRPLPLSSPQIGDFSFSYKFEREIAAGGFPDIGTTQSGNPPKIFLDGVLVSTISAITPSTQLALGSQSLNLSDLLVHEVTLVADTTGGFQVGMSFQVQIKPFV